MKRLTNRKFRLRMRLQGLENGKVVSTTTKQVKARIVQDIEASPLSEFKILVTYDKDIVNEGHYSNKKDLIFALNAFTKKPLLDYISSGRW